MKYEHISMGRFVERPNRFIAYVDIAGKREKVHVKNTGRCKELLKPGTEVYLEKSTNPERSTAYDLVCVNRDGILINMDSQAPNAAVKEWLASETYFKGVTLIRPETVYGNSRFDFYVECGEKKIFIEVKGVTLEENGEVRFPDAPSERAAKHMEELILAKEEGYEVYVLFVIQMSPVSYFKPNDITDPKFCAALRKAAMQGVTVLAYDCIVTKDTMTIQNPVPVFLSELDRIATPLLQWFSGSARILPWRSDPKSYKVWVSEIMLQQTRVEAVKPYFDRFMRMFPTVQDLANAEEEALLKSWEGLGYYNRIRNMKKAAVMVCEQYGGILPDDYEELQKLPGIGSYTAGAVASIAYGKRVPAVDGNVLRVLARVRADYRDILDAKVKKEIEKEVTAIMPIEAGAFNQALMELGALVCIPNGAPKCEECPWESFCRARAEGKIAELPVKSAKKKRTIEEKTVLIIQDGTKTVLHKRPKTGLLAGFYEFPMMDGWQDKKRILQYLKELGITPIKVTKGADAKHIFTHKEWHMVSFVVKVDELEPYQGKEDLLFVETKEAEEKYPLPSAFKVYTNYLQIKTGNDKF